MFQKIFVVLSLLSVSLFVTTSVFAQPSGGDTVCFCHNINNNPVTVCTDNQGLINGHQGHVDKGDDTLGSCPEVPVVPEFGLITGGIALLTSASSYYIFKKRK